MEKVIFDTNGILDKRAKNFLWNRIELENFQKYSEIIIPDMVIWELEEQIKRNLYQEKEGFIKNSFSWLMWVEKEETEKFDIERHIEKLKNEEIIKYTVIELTDFSVLEKIKEMAL